MITWAVGHLVGLAEPDAYDPKLKKWRFADLPIIPDEFKLVPNDERAEKQLKAIHKLMADDEIELVVNACDAGREGELIFAYLYELAKVKKPVKRLWLSSMTQKAIGEAFEQLRPGEEMKPLEAAARSRSEADWVVGMNATRAASIRLRAAFDGAVSLGRVQTPTLALVARREEEIRAFKPEPYWLVEAQVRGDRAAPLLGPLPGRQAAPDGGGGDRDRRGRRRSAGRDHEAREEGGARAAAAPLRPDFAAAPREHALRLLGPADAGGGAAPLRGAQGAHLPAHQLALPDRRHGRRDQADRRAGRAQRAVQEGVRVRGWGSTGCRSERVVNDKKVQDHHAIIPTRSEHDLGRMGQDELKVYDLVAKRFLAIFHPEAVYERTRVETTVDGARVPDQRPPPGRGRLEGRVRRGGRPAGAGRTTRAATSCCPSSTRARPCRRCEVESMRKETQPPRRFTDASLLGAMETAGKEVEDAELREAMKDSGIGTPATRASIIELLVNREYVEREGRSLVATEKGIQVIRLLNGHRLTSPELTGSWEHRLGLIEQGEDSRESFMRDIAKFTGETVAELDKLKGVRIERAKLGPCPICGREISENRKGFSCWSREDPGCGFVIWKKKAGKSLPVAVAKELIASLAASRERGEDPGVGRTEKAVTGFRGRSGRTFRAKLRLEQQDEGKWRVEFDEEWAKEPPKGESEEEKAEAEVVSSEAGNGSDQEAEAPAAARAAGGS